MDSEVATSTFTYIAVEDQIHNLWKEIADIRKGAFDNGPIKDWELLRLMEVHNQLDIESTRQRENHLKCLLNSLKLEEINGKAVITGGLKAHIQRDDSFATIKTRSHSLQSLTNIGFVDPLYEATDAISAITQNTSNILIERKRQITHTLIMLNHKQRLTKDEIELRENLMAELKSLNEA